jgi:Na+/H+ antiporter NhaC
MEPVPLATTLFRYFIVDKFVLNVLSETVGVLALLTAGNMAAATLPTRVTDARILAVLKFISPTLF